VLSIRRIVSIEDFENIRKEIRVGRDPNELIISVCTGTGCIALGARKVVEAFKEELEKEDLKEDIEIKETGCLGSCELGPRVIIYPDEICYFKIKPEDIPEIISKIGIKRRVVERVRV